MYGLCMLCNAVCCMYTCMLCNASLFPNTYTYNSPYPHTGFYHIPIWTKDMPTITMFYMLKIRSIYWVLGIAYLLVLGKHS